MMRISRWQLLAPIPTARQRSDPEAQDLVRSMVLMVVWLSDLNGEEGKLRNTFPHKD